MLGLRAHGSLGARIRPFSGPNVCHVANKKVVYAPSVRLAATKIPDAGVSKYVPSSAKDAIERGTQVFKDNKDYAEAVRLYTIAMEMRPNDDEARAALYNMGCAQVKLKQWKPATDNILQAINKHNLKLSVALKVRACVHGRTMHSAQHAAGVADEGTLSAVQCTHTIIIKPSTLQDADLKELHERREWADALTQAKGGLSRNTKIDLRSEAKVDNQEQCSYSCTVSQCACLMFGIHTSAHDTST